ncbi:MAG: polysaccharide biosynthesis/export family protein [Prochlorococcus marinus XMU1422]|nr:polysaccharide biosynthesis/export family protein [Prochlorococcus marinus XMU1421]MBO7013284.1 polysaccharide biosynthesis/export family protein [Prochlorococcus marinus XMU1422]MCR8542261.1 polysaccharide biosynthesis/export family protein [Prochlorococcus marinus XMU1423]
MKISSNFLIKLLTLFSILSFPVFLAKGYEINSSEDNINKLSFKTNDENLVKNTPYILGPGDALIIKFEGLPIFNNEYTINQNGEMILPELNIINAEGKTIQELETFLEDVYKDTIKNPEIKISISRYRPVTVYLGGAINRTGIYTLEYKSNTAKPFANNTVQILSIDASSIINSSLPPKLIDALQLGSGISNQANISEITVIRKNSMQQGGGKIKTTINLIKLLEEGDLSQNINLRDGDYIYIPETNSSTIEQLAMVNKSNITPDSVQVYVNGNIQTPGRLAISQGSSLYEAIAASGGRLSLSGKISFLRLKNGGKSEKRIISYSPNAKRGSKRNPILQENDIIFVRKNALGKATELINDFSTPILSGYGLYSIFN